MGRRAGLAKAHRLERGVIFGQFDAGLKRHARQPERPCAGQRVFRHLPPQPLPAMRFRDRQLAKVKRVRLRRQHHAGDGLAGFLGHPDLCLARLTGQCGGGQPVEGAWRVDTPLHKGEGRAEQRQRRAEILLRRHSAGHPFAWESVRNVQPGQAFVEMYMHRRGKARRVVQRQRVKVQFMRPRGALIGDGRSAAGAEAARDAGGGGIGRRRDAGEAQPRMIDGEEAGEGRGCRPPTAFTMAMRLPVGRPVEFVPDSAAKAAPASAVHPGPHL